MKRLLSILLTLVMLVSVFTACSKKEEVATTETTAVTEAASEATTEAPAAEIAKLIVWGGVPGESGPQSLVDAWNAEHPDIQVEYVRYVNDETGNTKLDTALLSGEQIDLYFTYSVDGMKKRVEGGMMEPLTSYGVEDFAKENIVGGLDGLVTINDALYALPTAKEPVAMMLNKNMLDALNITIPENWTVEQFSEIAKQLTAEVDGKKVYGTSVYY
ncbi:MAG: carbohydrate ABC transporter substrate-binding protein, partial [Vallitaleaceae bacterium]|nr:carbohydrate ABC transporter substrate-binding protein [Vallitaleaceae bacterium]